MIAAGVDPGELDIDPVLEANKLKDSDQNARAKKLLECLLGQDMCCLPLTGVRTTGITPRQELKLFA
ncbi:MAG: hypothetical protein ABSD02_22305 [Steroidobacteraceae bacterium]